MATIKGGQKLESELKKLASGIAKPASVKVGFLAGATYPDGKPVAMIAAIQDYGAPSRGIPPRPFFRNMVKTKKGEWPAAIAGLLKSTRDAEKTLQLTGEAIAGQLRQSIRDTNSPPLAASTIRRKGFATPLIDTGHMLNSVDYEVKTG